MKVIVISNYSVIREGILSILSKYENISILFVGETVKEAIFIIKSNMVDIILLDIHKDNENELNLISELKASGVNVKSIMLDFNEDNEIFINALKYGVQGYVLGKSNEEEILYAIDQVYKGKKYFDSYFVDFMINEGNGPPNRLHLLTDREKEILAEIAMGFSNRKIAEKLSITEHTVKKHISHIFDKLSLSERTEVVLYANKYGMMNK